jgi:hypothetical protein
LPYHLGFDIVTIGNTSRPEMSNYQIHFKPFSLLAALLINKISLIV